MNLTLSQMRLIATGALLGSVVLMGFCRLNEHAIPWLVWPRAFFEAATVGAMADWFAVVALFRHPMGIPIWHTAILPRNKGKVAESLANFLEASFLTEEQLGPRFRRIDYAGFASRWLGEHAALLAEKAVQFAPNLISGFSDEEMEALLGERARELILKADVAPLAGQGLEVLVQNGRDREIFLSVLTSARGLIADHRGTIQKKISEEIPLSSDMLRGLPIGKELVGPLLDQWRESIASSVATKTIEKVQAALDEAGGEPDHPLWRSFDERLRKLINDLKSSPEMAGKMHALQEALATSGVVNDFASKAWQQIKEFLLRDCAEEHSTIRRKIEDSIRTAARQLADHGALKTEINAFLGEQVLASIIAARPHARELVISTINAWDPKEMADKLEGTVGADLQYIRLSGTLVGGLMGLTIHAVFYFLEK